jgi:hypothetical protein
VQEHRGTIVDGGLTVRISNLALPLVETVALSCTLVGPALAQPCATDSDCAAALSCKSPGKECSQGAMLLPDGGTYVTQPICETLPSKCTWVLSACQADSDCALPNWGCLLFPNQATVKVCFPEQKSCSTTQACPASWSCITSALPSSNDPSLIWGPPRTSNYCWPDSLAGILDGTMHADSSGLNLSEGCGSVEDGGINGAETCGGGTGISISGAAGSNGTAGGLGNGTTGAGPNLSDGGRPYVADSGAQGSATTQPAITASKSGCAIAGPGGPSACFAMLALALVGLLGRDRTARRR